MKTINPNKPYMVFIINQAQQLKLFPPSALPDIYCLF